MTALKRRIEELEASLAVMPRQRERARRWYLELYAMFPHGPPTEAELIAGQKTATTKTISEFLADFERDDPAEE